MDDAAYLRSQADLCLRIAHQMSDPKVAEGLRVTAAQYLARAMDAEADAGAVAAPSFHGRTGRGL